MARTQSVVLVRDRRAEQRHDPVALYPIHRSLELLYRIHH